MRGEPGTNAPRSAKRLKKIQRFKNSKILKNFKKKLSLMKKTSHTKKIISIMLFCTMIFTSCLKENFTDCPEIIRVYFNYNGDYQSKYIDQMNLFVFSNNGYFLYEFSDDAVEFSNNYFIDCSDLYPGKFRFIAWAGKDENSYAMMPEKMVRNKTTLQEALLMLNISDDNSVSDVIHPLFYSVLPATVTKSKEQYFEMSLEHMTNTIIFRTIGMPDDNSEYMFEIDDNNNSYLFDGTFTQFPNLKAGSQKSLEDVRYISQCDKDEANQLNSTLNIMRMSLNRYSPQMQVYNKTTGDPLFPADGQTGNLIDLIRKANPKNDFDKTNTYEIVLNFGSGNEDGDDTNLAGVTISINGWEVRDHQEENLYD